jgi:glucose-6-phosphate dehydrogenase assembly protein OpcA
MMVNQPIESLAGAPEGEVELGQVERELSALWAAAPPGEAEAEPAVLRACALNLLVLGCTLDELERARPRTERTSLDHPARILLLASLPDAPGGIGARVSAFCHRLDTGGRHVCCEELTVLARGAAAGRLPEAVLPLLLPDMPVYLWILGGRQTSPGTSGQASSWVPGPGTTGERDASVVTRLMELADRVIWSARVPDVQLPAAPDRPRGVLGVDLDWLRILPWLELTAQLFDSPERRPLLERLEAAEVVVAGPQMNRPGPGWLWLGWLAARLGWQTLNEVDGHSPAGEGRCATRAERRLHSRGAMITARVLWEEAAEATAGELLTLRLYVQGCTAPLTLERQPAPDRAHLWVCDGAARCVYLGIQDEAALLGEALARSAHDPIYEASWRAAVQLWQR